MILKLLQINYLEIIGIKRGADIVEHFEKYIITLKDDTQLILIDKEAWNNLGLK